jgi:hypothetical protein
MKPRWASRLRSLVTHSFSSVDHFVSEPRSCIKCTSATVMASELSLLAQVAPVLLAVMCVGCGSGERGPIDAEGTGVAASPSKPADRPKRELGLQLTLAPTHDPGQRPGCVKLVVTNATSRAVAWDTEFCAFLYWSVEVNGKGVRVADLGQAPPTAAEGAASRFRTLEPGESIAKEFVLSDHVREFRSGREYFRGENGEPIHRPIGYEESITFRIPKGSGNVSIQAIYDSWPVAAIPGAFDRAFGIRLGDIPFLRGRVESNRITMLPDL